MRGVGQTLERVGVSLQGRNGYVEKRESSARFAARAPPVHCRTRYLCARACKHAFNARVAWRCALASVLAGGAALTCCLLYVWAPPRPARLVVCAVIHQS